MLSILAFGQPGATKLNTLEWAPDTANYVVFADSSVAKWKSLDSLLVGFTSDDQVLTIAYDNVGKILSGELEDGGGPFSLSLFDLEDRLQLVGDALSIIGNSEAAIDLSGYSDDQIIDFYRVDTLLYLVTEKEGINDTLDVNIKHIEVDPLFVLSAAAGITQGDIDAWRDHIVNDQDIDPTNELLDYTKTLPNEILFTDGVTGGQRKLHFIYRGPIVAVDTSGGSGSTQNLFIVNDSLFISGGNGVPFTPGSKCLVYSGITTASFTLPAALPSDPADRQIYLQGVMMTEVATPTHRNHVNITNDITLNFNVPFKTNYSLRVCGTAD